MTAPFPRRTCCLFAAALVAAHVLCLPAGAGSKPLSPPAGTDLRPLIRPGEKAPPFLLRDLHGKAVAFFPGDGTPALLVFWSAFCPLCRELAPEIVDLAKRYKAELRVIGVNLDGKRFSNAVSAFLREFGVPYPVGLDEIRNDLFIASDPYGIEKTPTAVFVDGAGIVRGSYAADDVRRLLGTFEGFLTDLKKGSARRK